MTTPTPTPSQERNRRIIQAVKQHKSFALVAQQFGLTRERVRVIFRTYAGKGGNDVMPPRKKYHAIIPMASADPELRAKLDEYAERHRVSISEAIRRAIKMLVAEAETDTPKNRTE